jgi:2-desacetyl-2-hydroxyethyl bacteriochlorophyllide A dehydrogenase
VERKSLFFSSPFTVSVRTESCPQLRSGEVLVKVIVSAISPGTELLVYKGEAPTELEADSTISSLSGSLQYPLKYGYSTVGEVVGLGDDVPKSWLGKYVFAFNPHETYFVASTNDVILIPENIPLEDAVFLPNMESAINFIHDAHPYFGDRVAIVGQGIVGLLTVSVLSLIPTQTLVTLDLIELRRKWSLLLGATESLSPEDNASLKEHLGKYDVTIELSGQPLALNTAIAITGYGGRIILGSWYGTKHAPIDLGGYFHRSRIEIMSSQVSTMNPAMLGRWSKSRRLDFAWQMIKKIHPSRLISHAVEFTHAAQAYELLHRQPDQAIQVILKY